MDGHALEGLIIHAQIHADYEGSSVHIGALQITRHVNNTACALGKELEAACDPEGRAGLDIQPVTVGAL